MAAAAFFEEDNLQALLDKVAKAEGFKKPTYSISNASKPGQNFIGRVFRVVITENQGDGEAKRLSLIFKATSTNRARQDMIGGQTLFRTEQEMYEIVLPTLNNFLKKHGVADQPVFPGTARCLATEINDATTVKSDIIVLDDKKVEGFQIVDMKTGLNEEQCRLALKRLALFHATPMALRELEPESADRIKKLIDKNIMDKVSAEALEDWKRGYHNGLKMLDEPFTPGNPTYDSLYKNLDDIFAVFNERFECPEDIFTVAHNDFTPINVMFKLNEDGSTEDACIIDFQLPACNSFGTDLATLLIYGTTKEMRDQHFENLLQFYYDEVTKTLRAFGCDPQKIFPWNVFQKHLKNFMKFGVYFCIIGHPILLADASEIKCDIHATEGSALFTDTVEVTSPETTKLIKQRIQDAVSDGVRWGYI